MMRNNINSIHSIVCKYIKNEIESGNLNPGDKLPSERELVKKLNVSRSSIREAIKFLTVMGYLEPVLRKGTFVSRKYIDNKYTNNQTKNFLEIAPIYDLMEVRMFLEERFIPLAVERATVKNFETMNAALKRMKKCGESLIEFLKADLDFHFALAEATNNVVIIELMKIIIKRIKDNNEQFLASSAQTREATINAFERIIFNIANKNVNEATLLYRRHIYLVDSVLKESVLKLE